MLLVAALALAAIAGAGGGTGGGPPKLMDWPDLLGRPLPTPTRRIPYGLGPMSFGELWLPAGAGPYPVVLMAHGGCWRSNVARLSIMNYAADDLRRHGYAVWNVEYRGVDRPGGGWPGTFADVAAGADELRALARAYPLRIDHVVALGHSAGGHLALWLAARPRLPQQSALARGDPLPIAGVLSLGGLPDLEAEHARGPEGCGADSIEALTGRPDRARPDVYAETSPARLGAGRDREVLINGAEDPIAPPADGRAYAAKMRALGARIESVVIPASGHVELIAPGSAAWSAVLQALEEVSAPL